MSEENDRALEAARLYAGNATFNTIATALETSKSHAQTLVRRGIELSLNEHGDNNPKEPPQDNPGGHQDLEESNLYQSEYPLSLPQRIRPESYTLETSGVPKRIILTPKALMVFEIWCSCGFDGDLSDFIEDSIDYMYQTRKPADRRNNR